MSNSQKQETPVDKYKKLKLDLKHAKKALSIAERNISKISKELGNIEKKLWFCPKCNNPYLIPAKKQMKVLRESREEHIENSEDFETVYYDVKYAYCECCDVWVLIEQKLVCKESDL